MKRWLLGMAFAVSACAGPAPEGKSAKSWDDLPPVLAPLSELSELPAREEQYRKLCELPRQDSLFLAVCAGERPEIPDLASLIRLLGLHEDRAFALTGNSTSLVKSSVSAVNPRAIIFPRPDEALTRAAEFTVLTFVRGEPVVEAVSRDLSSGELNFYLLNFERACDYEGGCDLTSLFSEELERGWTAYSIYTEEDLENTPLDCRSCHQPAGFGSPNILRMQELASPWLHWFPQRFVQRTDSDRILTAQFLEAHALDSQYAGIPIASIESGVDEGSGAQFEAALVAEGHAEQPNVFDPRIEAEAKTGEESPTWLAQFELGLRGDAIPVPYPLADVTDQDKRQAAVQSYLGVISGAQPRESLLDLRDVFSQDALEKLSLVPQPGSDGRSVLVEMCSRCHDGRGNQAQTRQRFNVRRLDEMSRDERDTAMSRLVEPVGSPLKMPPWRAGTLTEAALESALAELRK